MDKSCRADKCDCRLTLAVRTVAELIRLMNGGDAVEGEERAGQTDLFED